MISAQPWRLWRCRHGAVQVGGRVPARVPQHSSALAEAACYRSVFAGLCNYPGELFSPGFPLLFKVVTHSENA